MSGGLVSLFPLGAAIELLASLQAGFVPLAGVKNPYVRVGDRDYSYDWGGMGKAEFWLRHPRIGTVAVRCGRFPLYTIGGAVATTGLAMAFLDHGTREWVEDHQKTSLTNVSLSVTHLGEAPFLLGLSAVLYAGGEAFKNDSLRKTGLLAVAGVIAGRSDNFVIGAVS